jgi:dimeric dUTPase (all-alpha-NTP-PPase superfamily)
MTQEAVNEQQKPSHSIQSILTSMFNKQHELNKIFVSEEYYFTPICLEDAIIAESGELLESAAYKWWKNSDIDLENIKVEIVDIWHFLMTRSLIIEIRAALANLRTHELTKEILDEVIYKLVHFNLPVFAANNIREEDLLKMIPQPDVPQIKYQTKLLNKRVLNSEVDHVINMALVDLMVASQMNFTEFAKRYMVKNVLNKLRQDLGDKTGEYTRQWVVPELAEAAKAEPAKFEGIDTDHPDLKITREDNEVAMNLILNSDLVDFTDIYDSLKSYYLEHTKGIVNG